MGISVLIPAVIEQCHSCYYGNTPRKPCPCLEWRERTDAHTYPKLKTGSGPAQRGYRFWSTVFVATVCQSSCHIAECWNPFSTTACSLGRTRPTVQIWTRRLQFYCSSHCAISGNTICVMICFMETSSDAVAVWFLRFRYALAVQLKSIGAAI